MFRHGSFFAFILKYVYMCWTLLFFFFAEFSLSQRFPFGSKRACPSRSKNSNSKSYIVLFTCSICMRFLQRSIIRKSIVSIFVIWTLQKMSCGCCWYCWLHWNKRDKLSIVTSDVWLYLHITWSYSIVWMKREKRISKDDCNSLYIFSHQYFNSVYQCD